MSGFAESSDEDTPALSYYVRAISAFERGEPEYSEELCRKAAKLYDEHQAGSYQRLGFLACQQCDYEASKKWSSQSSATYALISTETQAGYQNRGVWMYPASA